MSTHTDARALLTRLPAGATRELALQLLSISDDWTILSAFNGATATAWRPSAPFVVVDGDLEVDGNIVVATGQHDQGALIVLGDLRCRQVIIGHDQHLLVSGDLVASEAVIAELADSTTYVGGAVQTDTLLSGRGAWLSLASAEGFQARHCSGYVMVNDAPLTPAAPASTVARLVDEVLDREEWDAMEDDEREGEDIDDLIMLDEAAALHHVAAGRRLLRG
ncbi:MAG: hypothetical protein RR704_03655 [Stenotrophomonas sp.]|uniref:hypothetical protein n=1 Tax=Stenotrophomonas sp. TaxID=69392 RepID=UPI002FC5E820